ncbi:MAG: hypothetical protein ABL879_13940 [Devosia sp.]
MAEKGMKPYVKLASSLVLVGMGLFTLERYGLSEMSGNGASRIHLDPNLMSALVLAPLLVVAAGVVVFMWGKMRRL